MRKHARKMKATIHLWASGRYWRPLGEWMRAL